MWEKKLLETTPLGVLDAELERGATPGRTAAVVARAGVGKTAFLVQLALAESLRDRKVFHVAINQSANRVRDFYDELATRWADAAHAPSRDVLRLAAERNRQVHCYTGHTFTPARMGEALRFLAENVEFLPELVVVDGLAPTTLSAEWLEALRDTVASAGAELWVAVVTGDRAAQVRIPPDVEPFASHFDLLLLLEPADGRVGLHVLKGLPSTSRLSSLVLDPRTMLVTR